MSGARANPSHQKGELGVLRPDGMVIRDGKAIALVTVSKEANGLWTTGDWAGWFRNNGRNAVLDPMEASKYLHLAIEMEILRPDFYNAAAEAALEIEELFQTVAAQYGMATATALLGMAAVRNPTPVASGSAPKTGKWKPGDDIYAPLSTGNPPSDRTVGRRFWKNEANTPRRSDYTAADFERMRRGQPPQRYNADKGGIESMEMSHEDIPKRDGGQQMLPKWPQEHAAGDPQRRPGY